MQMVFPIIAIMILGIVEMTVNTNPISLSANSTKTTEEKKENSQQDTDSKINEIPANENTRVKIIITSTLQSSIKTKKAPQGYIYPNAKIISESENEILLESDASVQEVTEWYKNYIQENDMNTVSFVTTNTNNNILNRLAGDGEREKIDIEIKKDNSSSVTTIKILLK